VARQDIDGTHLDAFCAALLNSQPMGWLLSRAAQKASGRAYLIHADTQTSLAKLMAWLSGKP
jgi:hypothetical protein